MPIPSRSGVACLFVISSATIAKSPCGRGYCLNATMKLIYTMSYLLMLIALAQFLRLPGMATNVHVRMRSVTKQ